MSISPLPLGYCTNVHPGRTVAEVERGLDQFSLPVQSRLERPLAVGLWFAHAVVEELRGMPDGVKRLAAGLAERGLSCHTLNAFPYGDFHAASVKQNVYLPDWTQRERLDYTLACADLLAVLLPPETAGSISTLPIGFKAVARPDALPAAAEQFTQCALALQQLEQRTGRTVRIAIEPEPFCLLETTAEAVQFFQLLWRSAAAHSAEDAVRRHIGLCYDVCHQAVEFEDAATAIETIQQAGVRINKVQISCAIRLDQPGSNLEGREYLRRYVEPRYLHQTFARHADGRLARVVDLTEAFLQHPGDDFLHAEQWRVHFHVPVDAEQLGPLGTTRRDVEETLRAVAALDYAPHLEVETYTWEVMPGETPDIVGGITRELLATQRMIDQLG